MFRNPTLRLVVCFNKDLDIFEVHHSGNLQNVLTLGLSDTFSELNRTDGFWGKRTQRLSSILTASQQHEDVSHVAASAVPLYPWVHVVLARFLHQEALFFLLQILLRRRGSVS